MERSFALPGSMYNDASPTPTQYCHWSPTPAPASQPSLQLRTGIEPDQSQELLASIEPASYESGEINAIDLTGNADTSTQAARPVVGSRGSRGSYGKRITKEQELLIFQRCLQYVRSYENPQERKKKFWVIIGRCLEADLGRLYAWNTLKKRVDDRVLERRVYLEQLKTGEPREPQTDLEAAIDDWIEVIDRVAAEIEEAEASAKKARDEIAKSSEYRDALTRRMGKKRNHSAIDLTDPDSLPTGLEPFEDLPEQASPGPESFSYEPSPEPASASRSASRPAIGPSSISQHASSPRSTPHPVTRRCRPRRPRADDDDSQLLRQTLVKVADCLQSGTDSQAGRREIQQNYLEQRVRIDSLERRIDSQEGKLDQILDILKEMRR